MGFAAEARRRGEVPERPKGADCKSAGVAFGGSNPPLSTIMKNVGDSGSGPLSLGTTPLASHQADGKVLPRSLTTFQGAHGPYPRMPHIEPT